MKLSHRYVFFQVMLQNYGSLSVRCKLYTKGYHCILYQLFLCSIISVKALMLVVR